MINLYCSCPLTMSISGKTKRLQKRNNVSFGNRENDMKEIAGIITNSIKIKDVGFSLKRIIRLGEFYNQYPKEVINAMNEIINHHVSTSLELNHFDSRSIINQICKTIEKNNISELTEILKKLAVYRF